MFAFTAPSFCILLWSSKLGACDVWLLSTAYTVKPCKPLVLLWFHCQWNHQNCTASILTYCPFKFLKFWNPSIFYLPAIRPTNGERIGLVFLRVQDIYALPQICQSNYNLSIVTPFILHCFSFSLTGKSKGKKSLKRCHWIVRLILIMSC